MKEKLLQERVLHIVASVTSIVSFIVMWFLK
jgi:hypothetical protein